MIMIMTQSKRIKLIKNTELLDYDEGLNTDNEQTEVNLGNSKEIVSEVGTEFHDYADSEVSFQVKTNDKNVCGGDGPQNEAEAMEFWLRIHILESFQGNDQRRYPGRDTKQYSC